MHIAGDYRKEGEKITIKQSYRQLAGHMNSFKMAYILQHCMKTAVVAWINLSLWCRGDANVLR